MEKFKKNITNRFSVIKKWAKSHKREFWVLLAILAIGAFLRLYRISEYMTFLGDEGRDVIVVRRLLVNFDIILVGPGTSIGNMYLGPLYYYMMAPALALAALSPVGPAVQIALLGVITIYFVWHVVREWFGPIAAATAALLYAIAPTVIIHSRSSWNPNIMPFFALLTIYSVWRIWQKHELVWFWALGVSFAFVLQSHYLGLLLAPVVGIYWLLTLRSFRKKGEGMVGFLKYSLFALAIFAFLMSPLVIFDARHGWNNFDAIKKFFLERQTTVSARPWNAIPKVWPLLQEVTTRLLSGRNEVVGMWTAGVLVVGSLWHFLWRGKTRRQLGLLLIWFSFALIGFGVYKQQVYDHYYGFIFVTPFILTGALLEGVWSTRNRLARFAALLAFLGLLVVNLQDSPVRFSPNRQLQRSEIVARKILEESGGEIFNLAVLAERNYEDGYKYFLEKWGVEILHADIWDKENTISDQLFVVCEKPAEKCDPTRDPKAEIANFGWSVIDKQWSVGGVTLYKLSHSPDSP